MVLLFLLHSRVLACQTIEYEGQGVIAHEQADFYKKRKGTWIESIKMETRGPRR